MSGTTYDYFLRACSRSIEQLLGTRGATVSDDSGNTAIFWLEVSGRIVTAAHYKATTCTTLVAVCEHLSEIVTGIDIYAVLALTEGAVLALHPDIPEEKRGAVRVAVAALRSAAEQSRSLPAGADARFDSCPSASGDGAAVISE